MPEQDAQFVDSGQALGDMGVKMTGAFLSFLNFFLRMPSSLVAARPSVTRA